MVSIRLEGDTRRLLNKLKHLEELDKRAINHALGEAMRESTLERFKRGRDPRGKRWRESARAAQEGGQTLIKDSMLRNSIHFRSDAAGFAVGTNVIYGSTHQLGAKGRVIRAKTTRGLRFRVGDRWITKKQVKVTIPARPFLGLSEEDQAEIRGTIEDALQGE